MSARRDPFFLPAKKKPRTDAAEAAEEPKPKAPAAGGFRALLESQPAADATAPADENADEKRIRLAKKYLEQVRDGLGGSAAEPDKITSVLFSEVCFLPPSFTAPFHTNTQNTMEKHLTL